MRTQFSAHTPAGVVAFMQNQWFRDPERMKKYLGAIEQQPFGRETFIKMWLFYKCLSGKRLKTALGTDLCDFLVWEEASAVIGGEAKSAPPADPVHMQAVIAKHKPVIVVTFGNIAAKGLAQIKPTFLTVHSVHPAARGGNTYKLLDMTNIIIRNQCRKLELDIPPAILRGAV